MAKSRTKEKTEPKPGDPISEPATPDEVLNVPTGPDGETVQITREDLEKKEQEPPVDEKKPPEKPKKSVFKKKNDELKAKIEVKAREELAKERDQAFENLLAVCKEHAAIANKNGHKGIASDFVGLSNFVNTLVKRIKKQDYLVPRVTK